LGEGIEKGSAGGGLIPTKLKVRKKKRGQFSISRGKEGERLPSLRHGKRKGEEERIVPPLTGNKKRRGDFSSFERLGEGAIFPHEKKGKKTPRS